MELPNLPILRPTPTTNDMTQRKLKTDKPMHFGSISMSIAKGLYANGNYSLIMVLLYIDSRKQKAEEKERGYEYPYEYNAPDIHYNTGVGLKAVNKHLQLLEKRGALKLIKDDEGNAARTSKGAKKYKVVKSVYEQDWGPTSRGAAVVKAGQSEPCPDATSAEAAGRSVPSANAGQPQPGGECQAAGAVRECSASDSSRASSAQQVGYSEPSANAPRPGIQSPLMIMK
jgi:hypothetical protein